jgi:hypothetical protein
MPLLLGLGQFEISPQRFDYGFIERVHLFHLDITGTKSVVMIDFSHFLPSALGRELINRDW